MPTIYSLAGITASDYQFVRQMDNAILYEYVQLYVQQANDAFASALAIFVMGDTEKVKERYQLPLAGRMQRMSGDGKAKAVTGRGAINVEYPLEQFGDDLAYTREDFAYLPPAEFEKDVEGIITRSSNAQRHEILKALFNNTTKTFEDRRSGTLTLIKPLASGDADTYPPVLGNDSTFATEDHYLVSGYTTANISDINNPISTAVNHIIHHFGRMTGGIPTATMINPAEQGKIEALTNFVPFIPNAVLAGDDSDGITLPPRAVPGEIIGYTNSSWISVWDWIPATYTLTVHLGIDAPLKRRIDVSGSGLADRGVLRLTGSFNEYPLTFNEWTLRFGFGAANRLNGVVTQLKAPGSYDIPADYV
jgi:hypothetical protein